MLQTAHTAKLLSRKNDTEAVNEAAPTGRAEAFLASSPPGSTIPAYHAHVTSKSAENAYPYTLRDKYKPAAASAATGTHISLRGRRAPKYRRAAATGAKLYRRDRLDDV